jgi:hypothetical protein
MGRLLYGGRKRMMEGAESFVQAGVPDSMASLRLPAGAMHEISLGRATADLPRKFIGFTPSHSDS